jgi:hypothetical protein
MTGVACCVVALLLPFAHQLLGSHRPAPSPSSFTQADGAFNLESQEFLTALVNAAQKTADTSQDHTYASLSTTTLGHLVSGLSVTTGPVGYTSEVSADICADGATCSTIELAARALSGTCWFAMVTMEGSGGYSVAFGRSGSSSRCSAGTPGHPTVPESGWHAAFPLP